MAPGRLKGCCVIRVILADLRQDAGRGSERRATRGGAQAGPAWLLAQPAVTSPIVGVTKQEHLDQALAAVDVELTDDDLEELSAGYRPHAIAGHQ